MNEKRQNLYSFTSQRDLAAFFSGTLPKKVIKETIKSLRKSFIKRTNVSRTVNHLQFLKKCEYALVKLSKQAISKSEQEET